MVRYELKLMHRQMGKDRKNKQQKFRDLHKKKKEVVPMAVKEQFYMTDGLVQMTRQFSLQKNTEVKKALIHYAREYNRIVMLEGPQVAAWNFHQLVDEKIAEHVDSDLGSGVQCKKGCSFCCRMNVDMSLDEGMLLVDYCDENKIKINTKKLKKQAPFEGVEKYKKLPFAEWDCAFLDQENGECTVYEARPLNCRKLLVLSDPNDCDTQDSTQEIEKLGMTDVEIITSGAANRSKMGSLPNMVLEAMQLKKDAKNPKKKDGKVFDSRGKR